ncbi:MAG TPA: efflux RND transporter periplasmic adaptor subunit, partial [Beijerinckiaceae bacterium]|nr:efflux RND transporter periplasmic adaptor subunit [Beijerinckiaceae bacterium]
GQRPGGPGAGRGPGGGAPIPVAVAAVQKKTMPFRVEAVGTAQAIASVTIRSRVDSQIEQILFQDGAHVTAGDVLARLDSRAIEAQLRQAEANLARNRVNLDLAQRTLKRGLDLANQNFATQQRLDENRANANALEALVRADEAQVEHLKTQFSYYTIRAPISGKAGLANLKPGNMARQSDGAVALTTINQMSPIYVSFALSQRYFDEVRKSLERGDSSVEAVIQGAGKRATGKLALVENAMDSATGTIGVRAVFENKDEALWPGAITNLKITLREDKDVTVVPREAVQMGQRGTFVFTVVDGMARMRPVQVQRSMDRETIIASGLNGTETVVIDGQLQLIEGARVTPRQGASSALPGRPAGNL